MLTKELCHEYFTEKDGKLFWKKLPKFNHAYQIGDEITAGQHGYIQFCFKGKAVMAHRIVFLMHQGYLPKYIDHINGNRSDNRIENLREVSWSENQQNKPCYKTSSTGVKGVYKKDGKFMASIQHNKKRYNMTCETLELAKEAIELLRDMLHGQFANHGQYKGA